MDDQKQEENSSASSDLIPQNSKQKKSDVGTSNCSFSISEEEQRLPRIRSETTVKPNVGQQVLIFGNNDSFNKTEVKSAHFEFGSNSSIIQDVSCGFDSADTTSDSDFFTAQEAVKNVIENLNEEHKDSKNSKVDTQFDTSTERIFHLDCKQGDKGMPAISNSCNINIVQNEILHSETEIVKEGKVLGLTSSEENSSISDKNVNAINLKDVYDGNKVMALEKEEAIGKDIQETGKYMVIEEGKNKSEKGLLTNKKIDGENGTKILLQHNQSIKGDPKVDSESNINLCESRKNTDHMFRTHSEKDKEEITIRNDAGEITREMAKVKVSESTCLGDTKFETGSAVQFIEGTTLSVTIEEDEVSVFEGGATDDFNQSFLNSLRKGTEYLQYSGISSENVKDGSKIDDKSVCKEKSSQLNMDCDIEVICEHKLNENEPKVKDPELCFKEHLSKTNIISDAVGNNKYNEPMEVHEAVKDPGVGISIVIDESNSPQTSTKLVEGKKELDFSEKVFNDGNESKSSDTRLENTVSETDDSNDITNLMRSALAKNEEFRRIQAMEPQIPEKPESCNETEVISLVDDDDELSKKKKPAAALKCVNPNCMSGEDLARPAMFVLTYFGLKRSKDQEVCEECFNMVLEHQEKMSTMLKENKALFSTDFPSHKDVILLDSDEESFSDNESNLSDDTMQMIRENLDDVIEESLVKYGLDHQIRESCHILNNKIDTLEEQAKELNETFDQVQKTLDQFRKCIYEDFNHPIQEVEELHFTDCEIPPMPILKSKLQNQMYNRELVYKLKKAQLEKEAATSQYLTSSRAIATKKVNHMSQSQSSYEFSQDVIALQSEARCEPPPDLPPPGTLLRPKLRVGELAYTMKVSYFSIWVICRVIEVIPRNTTENDPSTETYRVRLENVKKNSVRTVTGKYLAYPTPALVQLKVGTRVISVFREEDDPVANKENYYVGVIAEPPKSTNKYRYLVFFDDGYTQYCPHNNILVVCSTSKHVWEDIHPEPRDFIRHYLQQYPERPMVKLSRGQVVKVEWNGRWWIVRVIEVDASLVKVHFDADKRTEWIYRGSTRLGPMYHELAAAKERQSGSLLRSRGFGAANTHKSDMPYVEYTRGDGDEKKDDEREDQDGTPTAPPRSVARKSTAKKSVEPPVISNMTYAKPLVSHVPQGKVMQRRLKPVCKPLAFKPHQCSRACIVRTNYSPAAAKRYDPLVKPLIFGFNRLTTSFRGKTTIMYRAPCGRMIRTQQEMLCYLQGTKSILTIDLFDFDFWVNPLNVFEEAKTFGKIEDLSYGKENVAISCVNELDHSMPQYVQYMTARQPAKDVNLNLDPEFLVGCDCKDDCEDRSKCSCWQLTMQGKAYIPDGDLDPLFGYQFRRLPERIATGIYECNSKCKCSATCQNRVAQQPLSCRLQLFKTPKKGWGIRCLHDIPRGAFICIYAGFLLTEQEANEGGKTYGDEYLAELDYIESVENLKEGYESEARELSELDDNSQTEGMDVEYEEEAVDSDIEVGYTNRRREDIRLRLRRRAVEDSDKESSRKSRTDDDTISISDDETDADGYYYTVTPFNEKVRRPQTFNATITESGERDVKYPSVRDLYGDDEYVYIMDAKTHGNIGRYLNHSCSPNVFVQNVFVDTHDLRFPWVAFFANQYVSAGTELTWDYNYDVGSVPGKVMLCYCGSPNCRGRLL